MAPISLVAHTFEELERMGNQGSIRMGPSTTPAWKGRYPTYEELDEWTGEPAPLEQLFPWQFITRPQREQRKLLRELKKQRDREGNLQAVNCSPEADGTWFGQVIILHHQREHGAHEHQFRQRTGSATSRRSLERSLLAQRMRSSMVVNV